MDMFNQITDHEAQAKARLIEQYKDATNINAIISVYAQQVQEFENEAYSFLSETTLDGSTGFQLDQMGTILDEARIGLGDDDYRLRLKAKIAENVSEGTPEDLISIFRILLNPQEIHYNEVYPAGVELTAIGSQDPISSIDRIKDALNRAKPAGVEIVSIKQVTRFPEFVFFDDTDPTGGGFRDLLVLQEDGNAFDFRDLESLIETDTPFVFFGDTDPSGSGLGDINTPAIGGDLSEIEETETDDASLGDVNDGNLGKTFATILETDDTDTLNPTAGFLSDII